MEIYCVEHYVTEAAQIRTGLLKKKVYKHPCFSALISSDFSFDTKTNCKSVSYIQIVASRSGLLIHFNCLSGRNRPQ